MKCDSVRLPLPKMIKFRDNISFIMTVLNRQKRAGSDYQNLYNEKDIFAMVRQIKKTKNISWVEASDELKAKIKTGVVKYESKIFNMDV